MRILGLVPARGGSKGVPWKNLKSLCGHPLLWYTAQAALGSNKLSRVILSTDDAKIAEAGRECGLEVPFLRPAELAQDATPMLPVAQHAMRWMETAGESFDALCLLQPTNPLRKSEDIDACIELLISSGADAAATVLPVPHAHNPHWVYFRDQEGFLRLSTGEAAPIPRRQDLPPAFHREGSVYVVRRETLLNRGSFYGERFVGLEIPPERSVNIDTPEDWLAAERLISKMRGASL